MYIAIYMCMLFLAGFLTGGALMAHALERDFLKRLKEHNIRL